MRLVWTTDPHLNHVPLDAWDQWVAANLDRGGDGILITGDVSEADDVVFQLRRIQAAIELPVYFVLGNHDFYQSSVAATRRHVIEACRDHSQLFYLTDLDAIELADRIFLVGDDGWGDAAVGDYEGSIVRLNDFKLIDDFRSVPAEHWKGILQQQGEQSAARLERKLHDLPADAAAVIVLTHVPPFREACWYQGKTTDDHWAPFFVCGAVGRVLQAAAKARPSLQMTVLCGHTHNGGLAKLADNLSVYTGAADYGEPMIDGEVEVTDQVKMRFELPPTE